MAHRKAAVAKNLQDLLSQAAEVAVELSRLGGTVQGVPHYGAIERHAHELGKPSVISKVGSPCLASRCDLGRALRRRRYVF